MPQRIQLKRTKGWKMPPNTVKVDRTTQWGNPFRIGTIDRCTGRHMDAAKTVEKFTDKLAREELAFTTHDVKALLRGKNLGCWCTPGTPCHADVLLELANNQQESTS